MSSLAEIEKTGVTIINKIEHFGSEEGSRHFQYCVSRFQFPLFPESNFVLDYSFRNDLSSEFYVCLSRFAGVPEGFLELNGTFSAITSDGNMHTLGKFFEQTLEINTVKEFKLKNLSSIDYYGMEELFPNGVLTLRCHIWNSEEEKRKSLKMCFFSRCVVEKCNFDFTVDEFEEKISEGDYKCETNIPWSFKAVTDSLKLILHFKKTSEPNPFCIAKLYHQKPFSLYVSHKISLECANGTLLTFSENKNYSSPFYRAASYAYRCALGSELEERKEFFYPNGSLHVICNFKFITKCCIRKESVDYGHPGHSSLNEDYSAPNTERNLKRETLSDALYSLYEEEKFCDVTLRINHLLYPSHRAVLSARSEFFRTKFENSLNEKETGTIDLDDDPQILEMCLKYIYTDQVVASKVEDILLLFAMADKYIIQSLKKRCVTLLLNRMSMKHACHVLMMADMHNADDLKNAMKAFICEHAKEIINSNDWKILKNQFPLLALETMDEFCNRVL